MSKWKKIMPIALTVFMCAAFANGTAFAAEVSDSADASVETTVTDENTTEETVATDEDTTEEASVADESTSEEASTTDEDVTEEPTVTPEGYITIGSHTYSFEYADGKEGLAHKESYTGSKILVEPTVFVVNTETGEKTKLNANKDYYYSYEQNCTNVGTGYVGIVGMGEYYGENYLMNYTIVPVSITKAKVTMPKSSYVYTGAAITPKPTLTIGDTTLKVGTDYKLTYSSNTNVGSNTAKVKITAITGTNKKFTSGYITKTFSITKASLSSNCTMTLSTKKYTYNGYAKKPKVVVKNKTSGKTVPTSNYTVTYGSNKNPGYAKVKVKAKAGGNYSGSLTAKFKIIPKAVKLKSAKKYGRYIKVTWSSSPKATKYVVYRRDITDGEEHYSKIATTKKRYFVDDDVDVGCKYRYAIKAYSGGILSSASNAISVRLTITGSKISSITRGTGYLQIRWTKVSEATKYVLYRKRNGGSWTPLYASKYNFSYTDNNVLSGVRYYYKIVTYSGDYHVTSSAKAATYTSSSSRSMSAPSGFRVSQMGSSRVFYASWNSCSGVTGYEIEWSRSSSFSSRHFYPTSKTTFYPSTAACGTGLWYVRVRGVNALSGRYTGWSSVRTVVIR